MMDNEGQDINDLIQWLHRVSLDKQQAANEEQKTKGRASLTGIQRNQAHTKTGIGTT